MAEKPADLTRITDVVETAVDVTTEFDSVKVRHLADWWRTVNGGRMPRRGMFDILDHRRIVANLFLVEVLAAQEFLFKLLGEEVIQIVGRNRTGETVRRVNVGEYGHELYEYYGSIVRGGVCRKCTGLLTFSIGGMRRFESIDCPLAADQGESIAAIIGVMDVVK